ncbi:hypothetical protein EDD18DRAFT_1359852 [Armillaria luteobubalina]|uniref:Uncharacterized protein n=1 Tax=Armillaria luteobubalina TaxID=153913 RepID=A0AA39PQH5_9AGAR|nr:hypothetical protein EDD18DRAFT_1359852 [Armillaria luteobubalina]
MADSPMLDILMSEGAVVVDADGNQDPSSSSSVAVPSQAMPDDTQVVRSSSQALVPMVVDADGNQHSSSSSSVAVPSQAMPDDTQQPLLSAHRPPSLPVWDLHQPFVPSNTEYSFFPDTKKMDPMLPGVKLVRRLVIASVPEVPTSACLPFEKRANDSLYPTGQLESDDGPSVCVHLMSSTLAFHVNPQMPTSKVQLVEESEQTAARRIAEVQAEVDELRVSPDAEKQRTARADHARLVEELANLTRTFDDIVASRIVSRVVDDHRIQDAKELAQTKMSDASARCQSVSDQLSRRREQQQQVIADAVTRRIEEDSDARLTQIRSQLSPLRSRLKELREGLDASIEHKLQERFEREQLTRHRNYAVLVNAMRASLDEKFAQFADLCHKQEATKEGDLARALAEATAAEKSFATVLDLSRDFIRLKKKSLAQQRDAHEANLRNRVAGHQLQERHGQGESGNEGSPADVRVHDQVV